MKGACMAEEQNITQEEIEKQDAENTDIQAGNEEVALDSNDMKQLENSENLLEQRLKEAQDQYLRVHADFENVKKRLEREKAQALEYANQGILKDLLPIIDTIEKALESAKALDNGDKIAEGLELTLGNFIKMINKHHVEVIDTENGFDPNIHEAIMQVQNDNKEDGEIQQVLQKGYKYKERTLRPAMVSIVKNS